MLDLLIVHPGASHGIYGKLGNELVAVEPPLWCRLIAGYIRDRGFSVQIIDAEALKWGANETANEVERLQPRLICIAVYGHQPSASTQQMYGAGLTASEIKKRKDIKAPIVMVGGHVSALPHRTLAEEDIDYACVGEGPVTVEGLLRGYDPREIKGLVWDDMGGTVVNPSAPLLDLKELHGNTWDLLPMDKYVAHNWQVLDNPAKRQPYASVYTSRNCPFKCNFCLREGTIIVTKRGKNKPIEEIEDGEELLAWDEDNKKIVETKVIAKSQRQVSQLLKIVTSSGECIEVTAEHPIYTQRGWVEAGAISKSDQIWVMERLDKMRWNMAGDKNPMKKPGVAAKVSQTMHGPMLSAKIKAQHEAGIMPHATMSEEARQEASVRMTSNNPMHNPIVAKKVHDKIRALRKEGKLTYWMETEEGKRVIGEIARVRALSDANPMKDPSVVNRPELKALRSAMLLERWSSEECNLRHNNHRRGEEHPNWLGDIIRIYPPGFNNKLKNRIKERDGERCQNCGTTENLRIHHIDYVKSNLDECNLITTCNSCNVKANFVRPYWQAFYTEKLAARGYHCPHFEEITSIETLEGDFQVYNFECSPYDNYWAGFLLVHNCCISAPFQGNQYSMREPKDVVSEIEMLYYKYGVKTLKIVDEMFVLNERHYTAIANGLIATGIAHDLNIWAYARVDTVKPHTLKMLRQAGFQWLALGIESGSKHVRDGAEKALKSDDIISTVRAIEQAGIHVIANYIFGLPDDTYDSMQETLCLAMELNTSFANFYACQAYPGSKLYTDTLAERPQDLPESWQAYSQHNKFSKPLRNEKLSARDILAFRDAAFQEYFSSPVYMQKIAKEWGMGAVKEICKMTNYKLERNLLTEKVA